MRARSLCTGLLMLVLVVVLGLLTPAGALQAQTLPVPTAPGGENGKADTFVSPSILQALESKERSAAASVRVIVNFDTARGRIGRLSVQDVSTARASVLAALPTSSYTVVSTFSHLPALSLEINAQALDALRANPLVYAINEDQVIRPFMTEANALTGAGTVHAAGYTGNGIRVGIIDSGVDTDHPALQDDLFHQACFLVSGCPSPPNVAEDQEGHGTHVAGIITGANGAAPDVEFAALKVFGNDNTTDDVILAALNHVIANNDTGLNLGLDFLNMSLGGGNYGDQASCDSDSAAYVNAFATLNSMGVAVFVATGNDASITSVSYPACATGAIGVGSTRDADYGTYFWPCEDSGGPDKVNCYSNATPVQGDGELVDLLAPGCFITSTGLLGSTTTDNCGTSMATPYAVGIAALVEEYMADHALPAFTPAELEAWLEETGVPLTDYRMGGGSPLFPRVSPTRAINALAIDVPQNFEITGTTSTTADMMWDMSPLPIEYRIYRSLDGGSFTFIDWVPGVINFFQDTGVPCGELTYYVRAFDGVYESLPSNPDSVTARACPTAPTNLTLTQIDNNTIQLNWTDNADDETGYVVERRANNGAFIVIDTVGPDAETYTDDPVACAFLQSYRVLTVRGGDLSDYSNVVSFAPCIPDHDLYQNARVISTNTYNDTVPGMQYATTTVGDPVHDCRFGIPVSDPQTGTHNVWYRFTPIIGGELDINTNGSSGSYSDTILSIFTGTYDAFTTVECSEDEGTGLQSQIDNLLLTGGTTYTIYISRWNTTPTSSAGTLLLDFDFTPDPGVYVNPTTLNATEGDDAVYSVVLTTEPTDEVEITVTSDVQCDASPTTLTFTDADWDTPQDVTVTAVDDAVVEGDHTCEITHEATSADTDYDGIDVDGVTVNITDNDSPVVDVELLVNGDFEEDTDEDKVPDDWTLKNATQDKLKCNTLEKTVSNTGDCAFKFKGSVGEKTKLQQTVDLSSATFSAGDTLSLSANFKGGNTAVKAKFILKVKYASVADPVKENIDVGPLDDYTLVAVDTLILDSADVTQIKVMIKHKSTAGKLFVDTASLMLAPSGARAFPLPVPPAPDGFRGGN